MQQDEHVEAYVWCVCSVGEHVEACVCVCVCVCVCSR